MNDKIVKKLLKAAFKASKNGEVPVAALVIKEDKIISIAHNKRRKNGSVLEHAEIRAVRMAGKKLGDWRLNGCDLYVTLKPCNMCEVVLRESRLDRVFYLIEPLEYKKKYDKTEMISIEKSYPQHVDAYRKIFSDFFETKR